MAVIKGGFEIVKRAMLKELMKRGDDGIMLTLPKNEIVDLNARITMDRLIKAGQLVTGGGGSAAVVAGDKANPFSTDFMSVNAGALQNITKDIKPSAKRKILDAANIQ